MLESIKFDMAYIAEYSQRPGTSASKMEDNISKKEKQEFNKKETSLLKIITKLEAGLKKDHTQNDIKIYEGKNALWNLGEELLKSHHDFEVIGVGKAEITFLTKRQREIVQTAFELGYYDFPRKITLTQLSEKMNMSPSALSEILRTAHKKIVPYALESL